MLLNNCPTLYTSRGSCQGNGINFTGEEMTVTIGGVDVVYSDVHDKWPDSSTGVDIIARAAYTNIPGAEPAKDRYGSLSVPLTPAEARAIRRATCEREVQTAAAEIERWNRRREHALALLAELADE